MPPIEEPTEQTPDSATTAADSGASPNPNPSANPGASTGGPPLAGNEPADDDQDEDDEGGAAAAAGSTAEAEPLAALYAELAELANPPETASDSAAQPPAAGANSVDATAGTPVAGALVEGTKDSGATVDSNSSIAQKWAERRSDVVANWVEEDGSPRGGMEGEKVLVAQLDELMPMLDRLVAVEQKFARQEFEAEESRYVSEAQRLVPELDAAFEEIKAQYPSAPLELTALHKLVENGGLAAYAAVNRRALDSYFGKLNRNDIVEIFDMVYGRRISKAAGSTQRTSEKKKSHRELSGNNAPALVSEPSTEEERIWRNYQLGSRKDK